MSETRNNHYVPQWHQEGFFEPGRNKLAYLDLKPEQKVLNDGRVITYNDRFTNPTSLCFSQMDLYSTFFGASVNDEIERRLFGNIDAKGSRAIRAFAADEASEWHGQFQTLFEYVDIQKIRTPKGLDWLKAQYPTLTQNDLMSEMQGIRMMHCTTWVQAVREIVSAENSDMKFIVSDHPVTIYNHAAPPDAQLCAYPHEPPIALKASQTIFPLTRDFCLIFTNLEYAQDPSTEPLVKRTFARNFRTSMAKTDALIRKRKLTSEEVARINFIIKRRARRFIAAGRKEWLYPEKTVSEPWNELGTTLLPPKNELWHFGGEIFVRYEDGSVAYQDQFGRTEKEWDFLKKKPPTTPLRSRDKCGCGSGKNFENCCEKKPPELRPTWNEVSIRERNIMLYNGISNVLGLHEGRDWMTIRREVTDEKISKIYSLYRFLWPLETDLLQLLPKPDGTARAVYTGSIHPNAITEFALGASLYFGQLIIEHPFVHAGILKKEYNPVENPAAYRHEFLKAVVFFLTVMPLVDCGLVNLIPDVCDFDFHLREQMWHMAKSRSAQVKYDPKDDPRIEKLAGEDAQRAFLSLPQDIIRSQMLKIPPSAVVAGASPEEVLRGIEHLKERDPLAVLQESTLAEEKAGRLSVMKLCPNFEMTMYLAQATGSSIVTDSIFRWDEIKRAVHRRIQATGAVAKALADNINSSTFAFPQIVDDIVKLGTDDAFAGYSALMRDAFKYLLELDDRGPKPNYEKHLAGRFAQIHARAQGAVKKARLSVEEARVFCALPVGGIQDNTVNRLLLMSSSEKHLPNVPMAFFIKSQT
jgi:hypothetical protein